MKKPLLSVTLSLLAVCLAAFTLFGCKHEPVKAPTSSTLSAKEFEAIVIEAKRRMRGEDPIGLAWQSLDPQKLVRLMEMPEFVALPYKVKETLVDQAGAWELMRFDKPSDAVRMWERWYPGRIEKPVGPFDRGAQQPHAFYADARWAPESAAMMALFMCFPAAAWNVPDEEPMIWVMEKHASWDVANTFDFGQCVRQQNDGLYVPWPRSPAAPRGTSSARILEEKFSQLLLRQGCSGKGPDRCLPLFYALSSLNPQHEALPAILQHLEPDFALSEELMIPDELRSKHGRLNEAEFTRVHAVRRAAMRKMIFLSMKLPILLDRPSAWPEGELEKDLRVLLKIHGVHVAAGAVQAVLDDGLDVGRWPFANPFGLLESKSYSSASLLRSLQKLGRELASQRSCDELNGSSGMPAPFWLAFGFEKLARNEASCQAFSAAKVGELYAKAQKEGNPRLLQPIAALQAYLAQPGAVRDELINQLGSECPVTKKKDKDYWGVCTLQAQLRRRTL